MAGPDAYPVATLLAAGRRALRRATLGALCARDAELGPGGWALLVAHVGEEDADDPIAPEVVRGRP